MRNIGTLIGKELKLYFISPIAYVLGMVFLGVCDYLSFSQIYYYSTLSSQMMRFQGNLPQLNLHQAIFRPTFMNMSIIALLMIPILTMRLFAEEKKGKTNELLMTSPLSITEIILGKFLAAWMVFLLLLALTLHLPLLISALGEVAWRPLVASYLGLALMGAVFVSLGLFASSVTENQIVAAVLGFGLLIGFWVMGATTGGEGASAFDAVLNYLAMAEHLDNLVKGLIDTKDLVYFISMTLFALFLTHRVVESQRWK